jgi:hypothetical protein
MDGWGETLLSFSKSYTSDGRRARTAYEWIRVPKMQILSVVVSTVYFLVVLYYLFALLKFKLFCF